MAAEHERLLVLLQDLSDGLSGDAPETGKLAEMLSDFLICLSCHVQKEESILFPGVRAVLGEDANALDTLEVEHEDVSDMLIQFHRVAERLRVMGACDAEDLHELAELTSKTRGIMTPHIFKEDNVLYPLASQIVSQETLAELAARQYEPPL